MMICRWCGEPLRWLPTRGWVHQQGGVYKVHCATCGWQGAPYPTPVVCPACGARDIRDLHCALPCDPSSAAQGRTT